MLKQTPLALAIAGLLSAPIYADDSSLQETVVVTATRTNTQIFDTAASVTVIDDDAIEQEMVTGLDDIFRYTPGVTVKSNARQGIQSINIRGIEGNRIKVLVDGVAQGNQFDSGGTFVNSSRVEVDTDLLKAVEIVKGASSSLQGSDAIGGIIAFETKDPRDFLMDKDLGGHAKFNYSSKDNSFTESVALANRFGDLETLIAYTRHDGEQLENFGRALPLNSKANNLLTKLQYQLNDAHRLEFNGQYLQRNSAGEQEYENYSDASSDDETEQYQLALKHIWSADLALFDELEWQLAYFDKQENANTYRTVNPNVPFLNPTPIAIVQTKNYLYSDRGIQFDAQLEKSIIQGSLEHFLVYGASFQDKDIKNVNDQYSDPGGAEQFFYMPNASERRYGLFVQDQLSFGNWIITPGIRYDAFETNPGDASSNPSGNPQSDYVKFSDSAVTGRLATVYKLNKQHRLFAQVSQGFRAPEFKELYYSFGNPSHRYINTPNPDLKSEESVSYELGWRHESDNSSSEFALFYNSYDNFITRRVVSSAPLTEYQYVNLDRAYIKGVELSNLISWDGFMPVSGFSSRVAFAYSEGEDGDSKPINEISPWNAVVGLNYDAQNWGTSLNVSYTAEKRKSDINVDILKEANSRAGEIQPISSATVVDLTAYYKPTKDITLRAGIFNLTDEEYYNWNDVKGETVENKDLTQAGRNWAVTVKYDF